MKNIFDIELIISVKCKGDEDKDNFYYCCGNIENNFNELIYGYLSKEFNTSFDSDKFGNSNFTVSSVYNVKLMINANNENEAVNEVHKRIENLFKDQKNLFSIEDIKITKCNKVNDAENPDQMIVKCSEVCSTVLSIKASSREMAVEYIKDLFFNQKFRCSFSDREYKFEVLIDDASQAKYDGVNYHVVDLQDIEPHSKLFFDDANSTEINLNTEIKRNDFKDYPKSYERPNITSNYSWKFYNVKVDVILSKMVCVESKDLESAYHDLESAVFNDRIYFGEDKCEIEVNIVSTKEEAFTVIYWDRKEKQVKEAHW